MNNAIEELIARAGQHRRERKPADAAREWAEAVELSRQQDDIPNLVRSLRGAAQTERDLGRNREAADLYEEAVSLCRNQNNDPLLLAHIIRHLGDVRRHLGEHEAAQSCYEETLKVYRREPQANPLDLANTLRTFAILKEKLGDLQAATAFWREARELYQSLAIDVGVVEASQALARLGKDSRYTHS
jgi:tetratricopeptide (TPR) repeat protein